MRKMLLQSLAGMLPSTSYCASPLMAHWKGRGEKGAAHAQVAAFLKGRKGEASEGWLLPSVRHAPGFERYSATEDASSFAHEAG